MTIRPTGEYLYILDDPGEPYRPSNGTEGATFMECWCATCERDRAFQEGRGDSCPIVAMTLCLDVDHPNYPKEWTHDAEGVPVCTAYQPVDDGDAKLSSTLDAEEQRHEHKEEIR